MDFADEDFKTIDADKQPTPLGQDFVEKGFTSDEEEIKAPEEEDQMIKVSIEDLEDSGGDLTRQPEEEEEELELDEEIFSIGEDGEIIEDEEDSSGVRRFSRESYKRMITSVNDLRKYFKKNMVLWAERYEDEFFNDAPETNVDIESEEEGEVEEIPTGEELGNEDNDNNADLALDQFLEQKKTLKKTLDKNLKKRYYILNHTNHTHHSILTNQSKHTNINHTK